jgi:hypothetical protein
VTGSRVAAGVVDRLEDQPALADPEPGTAVLLRDQRREVARLGELGDELVRVLAAAVEVAPVLAGIPLADLQQARAERALIFGEESSIDAIVTSLELWFALLVKGADTLEAVLGHDRRIVGLDRRIIAVSRSVSAP